MASMRDIKGRIRSVTTTKKTTKAMNLVASSKLQRAKQRLARNNPYFEEMDRVITNVVKSCEHINHKFFEGYGDRPRRRFLVIVAANDRGLCGGYNSNVCKYALALAKQLYNDHKALKQQELGADWDEYKWQKEQSKIVQIYALGKKARDFFRPFEHQFGILDWRGGIAENPEYRDAQEVLGRVLAHFDISDDRRASSDPFDEIHMVYTEFKSVISHEPKSWKLLPLSAHDFHEDEGVSSDDGMQYSLKLEPTANAVLDYATPKYIENIIYYALSNAAASGQGATMTAMDSATENAEGIISDLTLMYNKARQGAITQEISEIVGGAAALE